MQLGRERPKALISRHADEFVADPVQTQANAAIVRFAAKIVVPESVTDPSGNDFNNLVKCRVLRAAAMAGQMSRQVLEKA
ncbi:MAG: hypothetical protein ACLQIQ_19360 [Beijerinckiaceae bacterium]